MSTTSASPKHSSTPSTRSTAEAAATPATKSRSGSEILVKIDQVTKKFDDIIAVDSVSLNIKRGEIFALLGGSGSGKSTLLRMLAGFETPSEGNIYLDGQNITHLPPYLRPINMMFQSYALFPHMTVEQNVAFGLKQDRLAKDIIAQRVGEKLRLVHMEKYARRKPHQLSGGQRQRVALARSLAKRPKLLLLDEPMGALDKKLRSRMQLEVVDIIEEVGVTCIMVTHDQEEAMTMAERIGIMDAGWIVQVGTPIDIYENPNSRMTAEFIGSVNMFEGEITEEEAGYVIIQSHQVHQPIYIGHGIMAPLEDRKVWIAVRPEKNHGHPGAAGRALQLEHRCGSRHRLSGWPFGLSYPAAIRHDGAVQYGQCDPHRR